MMWCVVMVVLLMDGARSHVLHQKDTDFETTEVKHQQERDIEAIFDDFPDNSRLIVVDRLKRLPQNERLIASIPSRIYEVIYPVQVRHHQKLGISTRDVTTNRTNKHFRQTTLLIKAFHYKFRLELELNDYLLPHKIHQKHQQTSTIWKMSNQEIEHCYYQGIVKDYPGAIAAFRTCSGISGIIHVGNDTFVIHPFYGGDQSRVHPHVIYKYFSTNNNPYVCGNSRMHEWGFKHFRKPSVLPARYKNPSESRQDKRDVRKVYKFIELSLVLDKAMFDARNMSRNDVISDAIQIINCVDMYYRVLNTRVSLVYLETWQNADQIDHSNDIRQTLLNFVDFASKHLYKQAVDVTHLLSGRHYSGREVGMAIPDTVCTQKAVGLSQDTNVYEPHLVAGTVTHMIGHNLGMVHDEENCDCEDSWGCIMSAGILGAKGRTHIQTYHFSKCSLNDYVATLRIGHGICLFNKPGELEDFRNCGNGVIEKDEECDCGTMEECARVDPCCDPVTCQLKIEANCSTGPCCENCQLRPAGQACRVPESECDLPEFCDGRSGECGADIFKKNGEECKAGTGFCFQGRCNTPDEQCEYIWGFGAKKADDKCFSEYNVQGSLSGNCGHDDHGGYIKCNTSHIMCGSLQCQRGTRSPLVVGMEKQYTRTIVSIGGTEYECKVSTGSVNGDLPDVGLVWDGTKCDADKVCINRSCISIDYIRSPGSCPTNNIAITCSGHGICSNQNSCFCDKGWTGLDCNERIHEVTTPPSPLSPTTKPTEATTKNATSAPPSKNDKGKPPSNTTYVARKDALSTPSLVMVLVSVVGGVFIFFTLLATCYRRSTVTKEPFVKSPSLLPPGAMMQTPVGSLRGSKCPVPGLHTPQTAQKMLLDESRIITFGSMPSYREDKIKQQGDTKVLCRSSSKEDQANGEPFIELSPHNLSTSGSREGTLLRANPQSHRSWMQQDESISDTLTEVERTLKSLSGYHEEILEALHSAHRVGATTSSGHATPSATSSAASPGQDHKSHADMHLTSAAASAYATAEELMKTTDEAQDSMPASTTNSLRIRNLEDLLRQLEQESPAAIDELGLSEPEADRHFRNNGGTLVRHSSQADSDLRYLLGSRAGTDASSSLRGGQQTDDEQEDDEDEEDEEEEEEISEASSHRCPTQQHSRTATVPYNRNAHRHTSHRSVAGPVTKSSAKNRHLRSASVEAIPVGGNSGGGFSSPPSEESGSYDDAFIPPLVPAPPAHKRKGPGGRERCSGCGTPSSSHLAPYASSTTPRQRSRKNQQQQQQHIY